MPDRADIAAAANELVGVKVVHQGRTRFGVDCIGLVVVAIKAAAFEIEDYRNDYGRRADGSELMAALRARLDEIAPEALAPGDVVAMITGGGRPSHVGIIAAGRKGGLDIIHACGTEVVRSGFRGRWRNHLEGAFRVPEAADG